MQNKLGLNIIWSIEQAFYKIAIKNVWIRKQGQSKHLYSFLYIQLIYFIFHFYILDKNKNTVVTNYQKLQCLESVFPHLIWLCHVVDGVRVSVINNKTIVEIFTTRYKILILIFHFSEMSLINISTDRFKWRLMPDQNTWIYITP